MSGSVDVDGSAVVNWVAGAPRERCPRLVGAEVADDHHVWQIVAVVGEGRLQLDCVDKSATQRTISFPALATGTLYFKSADPIPEEIEAERSPFVRLAETARRKLRNENLLGRSQLTDTEAIRLAEVVAKWVDEQRPPSVVELAEAAELLERSSPVTRSACALLHDWLEAIINSPSRTQDEPTFRIHYASLLRAARAPAKALAITDALFDRRLPQCSDLQRAMLLTIRAAALMDLYESDRDVAVLAEAERRLKNAWAIEGSNEFLRNAYRRLNALKGFGNQGR